MLFPTRVRRFYLLVLRNRKLLQTLVLGSVVHVVRLAQVLERREVLALIQTLVLSSVVRLVLVLGSVVRPVLVLGSVAHVVREVCGLVCGGMNQRSQNVVQFRLCTCLN